MIVNRTVLFRLSMGFEAKLYKKKKKKNKKCLKNVKEKKYFKESIFPDDTALPVRAD